MRTLANSEDPSGMPHQGLHYLLGQKYPQREKYNLLFGNNSLNNGTSQVYCMKPEGRIHLCIKGYKDIQYECIASHRIVNTAKPVESGHLNIDKTNVLKTDGSFMKVKRIAECSLEHSAILLTCIKQGSIGSRKHSAILLTFIKR